MANADNARGFLPVDDLGGYAGFQTYTVDAANATAIFRNDPLTLEIDGNVASSAGGDGVNVAATAKTFKDTDGNSIKFLPALTAGTIGGLPVKNQLYRAQAATGVTFNATDVNATCDFVAGTGDTTTGESRYELNTAGAGNQCRIMGLDTVVGQENAFGSEHATVRVAFVEDAYSDSTSI